MVTWSLTSYGVTRPKWVWTQRVGFRWFSSSILTKKVISKFYSKSFMILSGNWRKKRNYVVIFVSTDALAPYRDIYQHSDGHVKCAYTSNVCIFKCNSILNLYVIWITDITTTLSVVIWSPPLSTHVVSSNNVVTQGDATSAGMELTWCVHKVSKPRDWIS